MQFNEDFPPLPMKDFQNHYILVFDLTSLQNAAEQLHYAELCRESLRLERFFQFPLDKITAVTVSGEILSNMKLTISEHSVKIFLIFLSFHIPMKNLQLFGGLFIVIVSVLLLSVLFFFRPDYPEKADKECSLIENPRIFLSNWTVKQCSITLIQFMSFVHGTLLMQ